MITAVDTSVLLDVFTADPTLGARSATLLRKSLSEGRLIACDVVWAEVAASFPSAPAAPAALDLLSVDFDALDHRTALAAGERWPSYRRKGGRPERVVADFLIGAHAALQADRLLTRDRGFFRTYFEQLELLDPTR